MNTFNIELVKKIEVDLTESTKVMNALFSQTKVLPKYMTEHVAMGDYDMRKAFEGDTRNIKCVVRGLTHASWSRFFSDHNAHHLIIDREVAVQHKYVFADNYKRTLYNNISELEEFNYTNAWDFFNDHLLVNNDKCSKWLKEMLERTGKDYRNCNTEFKAKMSLRGLDSYGCVSREVARALFAACKFLHIEFTFDEFYTNIRNNRRIDGNQFNVIEGLDMTFELHQNGNTTVRIGKDLVKHLNDLIGK